MIRRLTKSSVFSLFALMFAVFAAPQDTAAQDAGSVENFGNWALTCPTADDNTASCEIRQILSRSDDGRMIAAIALAKTGGEYTLLAVVPLGSRLAETPTLQVDGRSAGSTGRYVQCLPQGCRVLYTVNNTVLNALSRGDAAQVIVTGPAGQPFTVEFSLDGFSAARKALDERVS